MAVVTDEPGATLTLAGCAERVNPTGPVTVRTSLVIVARVPDVPDIEMVDIPTVAALVAVSVSMLVVTALAGLNDAVTPAGRPETVRFTAPLNPFCAFTVMVLPTLAPAATDAVEDDVVSVN